MQANPIAQTATVSYDTAETSVAKLALWVRDCGYHCADQSVPAHVCDPLIEPDGRRPPSRLRHSRFFGLILRPEMFG